MIDPCAITEALVWLQSGYSPSELAGTFDRPTLARAQLELQPQASAVAVSAAERRAAVLGRHPKAPPRPQVKNTPAVRSGSIRASHIARHPIDVYDSPTFLAAALPPVRHPERSVAGLKVGQKVPMPQRPGIAYAPTHGGVDAWTVPSPTDIPSSSARYPA